MSTVTQRPPSWFNGRNVVTLVVALMILGVAWSIVAQWIPPSPSEPAFNSYSGTVIGFRGLYELLDMLGHPVHRNLQPPPAWLNATSRVLLLQPSILALELEKDYLEEIQAWVRAGGELAIVSDELGPEAVKAALDDRDDERAERILDFFGKDRLLAGFDIDDLNVANTDRELNIFHRDSDDWRHIATNRYADYRRLSTGYDVSALGTLAPLEDLAPTAELPGESLRYFEGAAIDDATGSVSVAPASGGGASRPIALEYAFGEGTVTFVAEPALLTNVSLRDDANAVLAYHLAAGRNNRPVLIDEYYHGSLAGQSALHVLTLRPFPIVALMVLIALGLWAWSHLVRFGPPEPAHEANRRSMLEYIDAMARLYRRGRKEAFILKTLRDGVLDRLRQDLHMPPGIPEPQLMQRLERRDRDASMELLRLLESIDEMLDRDSARALEHGITKRQLLELQGKLETCRWKNIPATAAPTPPQTRTSA